MNRRLDFLIEEAGCLIWVAPGSLGGAAPAEVARIWMGTEIDAIRDAVERGAMMPMSLYQDDGYLVRFVLGELSEQEEAEWTAHARAKLDVPCGRVLVSGILTPDLESDLERMPAAEDGGSYRAGAFVEVPPGVYRADVYAYPPGDLSGAWGTIANSRLFGKHPGIEPEKAIDYFRRTRPGAEPPAWIEDPSDEQRYVDFVVRLSPLEGELPPPEVEDDGCLVWEFRKPELCPTGLRTDFAG